MQDRLLISEILSKINTDKSIPMTDDFLSTISNLNAEDIAKQDKKDVNTDELVAEIYNQIIQLRILIDAHHKIQSRLMPLNNKKSVYVRYLEQETLLDVQDNKVSVYNYLRIFYAYLLAAIAFSKIEKFDCAGFAREINDIKKITTMNFVANLENADEKSMFRHLAEAKGFLINHIKTYRSGLDCLTINKNLDKAKDWVALDEPSMPVCTVIKMSNKYNNKIVAILDEPCSQLTPEQHQLFDNLSHQPWFSELYSDQQNLVRHYLDRITSGTSVIPSRLRSIVPLSKNAFKQSIYIINAENSVELINDCYHAGTVAHLSHKKESENIATDISRLNLLQQHSASQADAMVMICLNSEWADTIVGPIEWMFGGSYVPDDSQIIKLTWNAASQLSDKNIFYSKICLNLFRNFEFNDYTGIDRIISIVDENKTSLDEQLPQICKLKKLKDEINDLKKQITDFYLKGENIIHFLIQIAAINNQLVQEFPEKKLKKVAIWFGCASGENRTGIVYYNNVCASLMDYFSGLANEKLDEDSKQEIFEMIAHSQHIHVMTGYQGNTFGTDGIRSKSSNSLKHYHSKSLLTETSDIKDIPAYDAFYNKFLDELSEAIENNKQNVALKKFAPLVLQYFEYAKAEQKNILFFPDTVKRFYTDTMRVLEKMIAKPSKVILSDLQKCAVPILNINDNDLKKKLGLLTLLLANMVREAENMIKSLPSEQLVALGLFKDGANVAVSTGEAHPSRQRSLSNL